MTEPGSEYFTKHVSEVDPEIADLLVAETRRQETTLEMIASENFVPQAVMDCQGSTLTNKYAEGLPGKRYYGGCEHVDVVETLAIERAKSLFGAEAANVQPNGGASANAAAMMAMIKPGDKILGMRLDHGGHLTHGMKLNFSGKLYEVVAYGVCDEDSRVDMDALQRIAEQERPQLILGGWSAYSRQLDWARFREIADSVGALLMVDMAHFAGLVAAGEHPSPVPHADVVTTTIHKTLGGSRGGMILSTEEWAKKINTAVFPGQQGGPLMHIIAGKATSLKLAATDMFKDRQRRTRSGAEAVASELLDVGVNVLTGGTDVHLVLADLRESELSGQDAEDRLHDIGITVNRNAVPDDPRPAMVTSGLRIGTPALATRGMGVDEFHEIGQVIGAALTGGFGDAEKAELTDRTRALAEAFPLYPHLTPRHRLTATICRPSSSPEHVTRPGTAHRTSPDDVERCIARNPHKKAIAKLRRALGADDLLSPLETGFLRLMREHGLPLPRTNIDSRGDKVDCHWPEHDPTVELHSYRFHATRQAFENDIARRRRSGHLPFGYGDVFDRGPPTAAEIASRLGLIRAATRM